MIFDALAGDMACGVLDLPVRPRGRAGDAVRRLQAEGRVLRFDRGTRVAVPPASEALSHAGRVAPRLLQEKVA